MGVGAGDGGVVIDAAGGWSECGGSERGRDGPACRRRRVARKKKTQRGSAGYRENGKKKG